MSSVDLLVIGSGPAGMAAASTARRYGLRVAVVDDQPAPGGQIWRSIETAVQRDKVLGQAYVEGRDVARNFRECGAQYLPGSRLWRLDPGFRAYVSRDSTAEIVEAKTVILATGAQERPVPFPGWTLPGVLTVGAAQILLKNAGQVPTGPVWIAGSGPLPLLYAIQLLRAGGTIAGYLDTTPPAQLWSALRHLPGAMRSLKDLMKGIGWSGMLRAKVPVVKGVVDLEALGEDSITALCYRADGEESVTVAATTLLIHEGVVPSIHVASSLGCQMEWNSAQECFVPVLDYWGESSLPNLLIAGDGAGIGGAKAALLRGELAAIRAAVKLDRLSEEKANATAKRIKKNLNRELAIRPFLDALYRPRTQIFTPSDRTVVCRCEEVAAGEIRALASVGCPGPNQIKSATRAGMGPCQGRQCGYTVTRILADAQNRTPAEVGFYHVRPPLKPVTLGELASLDRSMST